MSQSQPKNNYTLVLTACIKVGDESFVKRNQTAVRLRDYEQALQWWLTKQNSISTIIFCDNSGHSLASLEALAKRHAGKKQVEFLSYHFTDYGDKGYGWGEIDIYKHVLAYSKLLVGSDYLAFCAGRKYVTNIELLCRQLPTDFDIAHNWQHNLTWAESDLFLVRRDVFTNDFLPLISAYNYKRDGYYIHERAISHATHELINRNFRWYPLPYYPSYRGVMGKKDISLWWRRENYPLYNRFVSLISRAHWRQTRTVFDGKKIHLLDRLKIRLPSPKLKK